MNTNIGDQANNRDTARLKPKQVFILGLGTSIPGGPAMIERCLKRIAYDPDLDLRGKSAVHPSLPMGQQTFQLFHNAACLIGTRLSGFQLLARTQAYESQLGRLRWKKNGPRSLDIDILWAPDLKIATRRLQVPHPGFLERWFAFVPAVESLMDAGHPIPPALFNLYSNYLSHDSRPTGECSLSS
jgi:2-amino-4-hydroxy-6-hydroxymethyldihydropteridine diphosphokinase